MADLIRRWWASFGDGSQYGEWQVQVGGMVRSLRCRLVDDGSGKLDRDPLRFGYVTYGMTLVADDPFWRGSPIRRSWGPDEQRDFFGGSAKAPPYVIGSSATMGNAQMPNPGDVAAFPTWQVQGDSSDAVLGLDGHTIEVPWSLAEGESVTVCTEPSAAFVTDQSGADRFNDLGNYDPASIPAGSAVPLSISMTGAGMISASITPAYLRPW